MSKGDLKDDHEGANELRAGWPLILVATVGVALGFPTLTNYSLGVFAPELARAFHWSYSQIMSGIVMVPFVLLFAGPIVGLLCDRFGVRLVASLSTGLLGVGCMGFAFSSGSLRQYYATWLIMSLLGAGSAQITWTRAINQRFDARRGLALGIALAGTGVFTLLAKPLLTAMVMNFGWRGGYICLGLLPIVLVVPAALWVLPRQGPEPKVLPVADINTSGLNLKEALQSWRFWTLAVAFIPMNFALAAPIPNIENILIHHSFSKLLVASITPWMGVTIIAGRAFGGWLADLVWAPLLAAVLLATAAVGCVILAQPGTSYPMAVAAVLLLGAGIGVEVDLCSYMTARYLGVRHYGLLFGILYSTVAIGAGLGPGLFAWSFDRTGSYATALFAGTAGLLISAGLLLTLGRYPDFGEDNGAPTLRAGRRRPPGASTAAAS
jgi:MFS family permease